MHFVLPALQLLSILAPALAAIALHTPEVKNVQIKTDPKLPLLPRIFIPKPVVPEPIPRPIEPEPEPLQPNEPIVPENPKPKEEPNPNEKTEDPDQGSPATSDGTTATAAFTGVFGPIVTPTAAVSTGVRGTSATFATAYPTSPSTMEISAAGRSKIPGLKKPVVMFAVAGVFVLIAPHFP